MCFQLPLWVCLECRKATEQGLERKGDETAFMVQHILTILTYCGIIVVHGFSGSPLPTNLHVFGPLSFKNL